MLGTFWNSTIEVGKFHLLLESICLGARHIVLMQNESPDKPA
jgi:hypothetical protein